MHVVILTASSKDALHYQLKEVGVYFFLQDYSRIGLGGEFGFELLQDDMRAEDQGHW